MPGTRCRFLSHLPVADPDAKRQCLSAREADRASRISLCNVEALVVGICDGEVCNIDLVRAPGRIRCGHARRQCKTENCQLEAEAFTVFVIQVARDIPPFVAELGVWAMILWKHELSRRDGACESRVSISAEEVCELRALCGG